MKKKIKIEYLQVSYNGNGLKSSSQLLSTDDIATQIEEKPKKGRTFLLNLKGIPNGDALLIFTKNKLSEILNKANSGISFSPEINQVTIIPLGKTNKSIQSDLSDSVSESNEEVTNGNPENQKSISGMTDSQRRYIFRLLAEKHKIKGEEAEIFLKDTLQVDSLHEISKTAASEFIEELLQQEGKND